MTEIPLPKEGAGAQGQSQTPGGYAAASIYIPCVRRIVFAPSAGGQEGRCLQFSIPPSFWLKMESICFEVLRKVEPSY